MGISRFTISSLSPRGKWRRPTRFWPRQWFGIRESLHLDAYGILDWADGHRIVLKPEKPAGRKKLFFVNMGGYRPGELREDHQFAFFFTETAEDAKRKAISSLLTDCNHQHRDNLMDVDDCILIEAFRNSCVHLEPAPEGRAFSAAWQGYRPI